MAKLDKEWLTSNLYDFEEDSEKNLIIIKNEPNSKIKITKETLPDNSITKYLMSKLKNEKNI